MPPVPTLHVEPHGTGLRYRLDLPERDVAEPLQAELVHPLDRGTVASLQRSAEALLQRPEGPTFLGDAGTVGRVLYNTLVPSPLREPLRALSGPLLVSTSLYGLPWELLYDGDEFWGLRYALGKRIVMSRALITAARPELRARARALIVGSDPRGDLPFVAQEVERVAAALETWTDITCVGGAMATFDAITAYLARGFDLIHYCGHVAVDPERGPGLLLADDRLLTPPVIEANLAGRPLVFLNGCASVRGRDGELESPWEESVLGVSHAFLYAGAIGAIGTLCPVSDQHAATLAEDFYRLVLAPLPVGEALRQARVRCRTSPASGASPSWLSFVLYGNPAQLLAGPATEPGASSPPAATGVRSGAVPAVARPPVRVRARRALVPALLVALAVALAYFTHRQPREGGDAVSRVVIGVMEVRASGSDVPAWMRDLTRDSLNAIFSHVGGVGVYSRQKIDFLREKRGLSEIEAAEMLGMSKMISTTLSFSHPTVGIDVQIVDIVSGLLEASEHVQGHKDHLIELQNEIAVKTLRALGVAVAPEQLNAILSTRTNDTLDSYKLLLETLGTSDPQKQSLHRVPNRRTTASWLLAVAVARAQELTADEAAIRALLAQYAEALRSKNIEEVATMQPGMGDEQRNALARYFESARELGVRISDIDVLIEGDEAFATFTREDIFKDARSGRSMRLEVRITGILAKRGGDWKIRNLRKPS